MCFRRIARKIKAFFVDWLPNRGYKFVATAVVVLWAIGMFINPFIALILGALWTVLLGIATFSYYRFKQALGVSKGVGSWTLKAVWQQFTDWREGRRRRKLHDKELQYGN